MLKSFMTVTALVYTLVLSAFCGSNLPEAGKNSSASTSQLDGVERLWSTVETHPNFSQVGKSSIANNRASVSSRKYKTDVDYNNVKAFYVKTLEQHGWKFQQDEQIQEWGRDLGGSVLTFEQGEYKLTVQYAGESSSNKWDYSISIIWGET